MSNKPIWDILPDEEGTFSVRFKNKKKLLYDGLLKIFSSYGQVAGINDVGNRMIFVKYVDKKSALNCYNDLSKQPDVDIDLPRKEMAISDEVESSISDDADIGFTKAKPIEKHNPLKNVIEQPIVPEYYVCRKRKIIRCKMFKRFMIALAALNNYLQPKNGLANLIEELKYQMRGISYDLETGVDNEIEHDTQTQNNETPELIHAKDLYYFYTARPTNAIDVLLCGLPAWYQQADAYKLILPQVGDDLLRIDWYRRYPSRSKECSFPYGIIYLKNFHAARVLRMCADDLYIDGHRIAIWFMEDVENLFLDVKESVSVNR